MENQLTLDYVILIAIGILFYFGVSLWALLTWPDYGILVIVLGPLGITPIYCLIASTYTEKKEIVSPVYLMVFEAFVALITTGLYYRSLSREELIAILFAEIIMFVFWIGISPYFQSAIRFLFGAYGEIEPFEENLISYEVSKRSEDIVFQIKKKWLGLLCGMSVKENKSRDGKVKLRLKKHGTNLYLAIYGEPAKGGETLLNIIPYAIVEDSRRRDIVSNKEIREFLAPQINQIEKKLGLVRYAPASSIMLLPETIEYALYPAKFPIEAMQGHRAEVGVILFTVALIMAYTSLKAVNMITETAFMGLCAISVSIAIAVVGFLLKR